MPTNLSISLRLGSAAFTSGSAPAPSVTMDNQSVMDKSASLARVGQLSGYSGSPTLSDDAGGRFIVTSTGEVRVGLVQPDRTVATTHNITVAHAGGSQTFAIAVNAITAATLSTAGSIQFPRRNGATAGNALNTAAGLYGIMGANVADGADGAVCFFFDVRRGSLVTLSSDQGINSSPFVMGMHASTSGRGFAVRYFPEDSSIGTGTALKGRICFAGKDHASVSQIGRYLVGDADGSPTGDTTQGSWLRSAVITDDVPRLVVLRYTKNGATWGGVAYGARTMQVITIRLDDFSVEYGDAKTHSAWVGMGTSASRTNVLTVGSYNNGGTATTYVAATANVANYFPGRISNLGVVSASGADTDWQAVAQGVALTTQFSGSVQYHWPLSGASDLAAATDQATAAGSMTVTGAVTQGTQMRPSRVGTAGLRVAAKADGYVYGLQIGGTTSRAIDGFNAIVIGAATHIQARVVRKSDSAVIVDWTRCTSSAATGVVACSIPGVPIGYDYHIELRREDDNSVVAITRHRLRVGFKFALVGQSQDDIFIFGSSGPGTGVSVPATANVSFAVHRPRMQKARKVDVGVLEVASDLSAGMLAMMERMGSIAPSVPWMIQNHCQSGESLGSFYADQVVYSVGQGGDGTYKAFGDYSTAGSGLVTDVMLTGGKDISLFLHMHGTADSGRASTYASLLNALYAGVSDGNEAFSNTPSVGGPTVTTSIVRHYGAAGLAYPVKIAMIPIQRHAFVGTGAGGATQGLYDSFRASYQLLRKNQAQWVPPSGVTVANAAWTHDTALELSTDTAHQGASDARGNHRLGRRYAMALLSQTGLSTYSGNPLLASATRSGAVITVALTSTNNGTLFTPGGGAPVGFEVSEDGGTTWTASGFTAAIASNTVTLTKGSNWAANTRVRYCYGGPIGYFTVSQTAGQRTTNYGLENADLYNLLYESRADAAPSSSSDIVQGVPIIPTLTDLVAA